MNDMEKYRILNSLSKYKIVSFDIFDTLLKRDVFYPTDIFLLVEQEYNRKYNKQIDFFSIRKNAEKQLRKKSLFSEVTLEEIYSEIKLQDEEKNKLKQLELDTESALLHYNYQIKEIFDYCLQEGKIIYLVSDMYLPKEFLEKVLQREGFSGYKTLYISCEYRENKKTGRLFSTLCKNEGIKPKDIIHIGDSIYADFIGPLKVGIKAIHIERKIVNVLYSSIPTKKTILNKRCLYSFINNRLPNYFNRGQRLGYEILGPIIYSYCKWIHEISRQNPSFKLWFAARDMYLFSMAYKLLYGENANYDYVYISRRSLRPILTQALGDITSSGNVFARGKYTIEQIIKYMGYTLEDVDNNLKLDLKKKYDVRRLNEYDEIVRALNSIKIIENESSMAKSGLEYLKEKGLFDKNIYLVDVGWHGTTQYILEKIQKFKNKDLALKGLYIGCLDGTNKKIGKENYNFFLFDEHTSSYFKIGIILFESLILAPHGTTLGYYKDDDNENLIPILCKSEIIPDIITDIQIGAIQFIKDFRGNWLNNRIDISSNLACESFINLVTHPQKEEIYKIGEIEYDNFYINKMANPKSLLYYIFHPSIFKLDFKYSPWRIGFLYKLFHIKLPYFKIYSLVRRIQGKQT